MHILIMIMLVVIYFAEPLWAQTTFVWDRNAEADVGHYEIYACSTSSVCVPGTDAASRIGTDVLQPAVGVRPTMPIPVGTEGRAATLAVDLVGNKSGLSNIVPFDRKEPAAPTNLGTQ